MNSSIDITIVHKYLTRTLYDFDEFMKTHNIEYSIAYGTLLGAVRHQNFIPWDDDIDIWITRKNFEKFLSVEDQLPSFFKLQRKESDPKYTVNFPKLRDNRVFVKEGNNNDNGSYHGAFIDFFILDGYNENISTPLKIAQILSYPEQLQKKFKKSSIQYKIISPFKSILRFLNKPILSYIFAKKVKDTKNSKIIAYHNYITFARWPSEDFFPLERKYKFGPLLLPGPKNFDAVLIKSGFKNYMTLPPEEERHTHLVEFKVVDGCRINQ